MTRIQQIGTDLKNKENRILNTEYKKEKREEKNIKQEG